MNSSRKLKIVFTAIAALAVTLVLAAPSGAATRIGQSCTTGLTSGPSLSFQGAVASGASYTAPTSGVITRWGSLQNFTTIPPAYARLAIASSGVGSAKLEAFSAVGIMNSGVDTTFADRIAISAGQSIGIQTFPASPICTGVDPANTFSYYSGDPSLIAPGLTFAPVSGAGVIVNVWADIEPDIDGDGYGDETQDKCPQAKSYQDACPAAAIASLSANKKQLRVVANSTKDASYTATATAKVGKKTVTFKSASTSFTAAAFKTLRLNLPSSIKSAIKRGKRIKVTVTLNADGQGDVGKASRRITVK